MERFCQVEVLAHPGKPEGPPDSLSLPSRSHPLGPDCCPGCCLPQRGGQLGLHSTPVRSTLFLSTCWGPSLLGPGLTLPGEDAWLTKSPWEATHPWLRCLEAPWQSLLPGGAHPLRQHWEARWCSCLHSAPENVQCLHLEYLRVLVIQLLHVWSANAFSRCPCRGEGRLRAGAQL